MQADIQIDKNYIPKHVAVIMDGNGRWARNKGLKRVLGHQKGVESVRQTVEASVELGIEALTLYAFSTENWKRPKIEIDTLMSILVSSLKKEISTFQKNDIKLQAIGNLDKLPSKARNQLHEVIKMTENNKAMTLTLALNYGAKEELIRATKSISKKIVNNELKIEEIDEKIINSHLYTFTLPVVDFLIRTSGEMRISNFLLWQIAYAELYFTDILWPDFRKKDFYEAILNYQRRERRFGKTSEQIESSNK
ncbi:isoprenyl transferase [Lutimonas saemankumensis]|uniref:isoprenyl transferase n=1 Tax=Lutimonas saemankumensis TaxID=483016 RepID=UPI001CD63795|nr:isoprenyl transferase [Lutimonas saemankumensis]MCA0933525.1 isoprenyl transferase [Lutimonas saemankumensis]